MPVDHLVEAPRPNASAEEAASRAVEWAALATRAIQRAGEQQAAYVNRHRLDVHFSEGDQVLLSSRNLPLEGTRKLALRWMGPFKVLQKIGPVAYRLELPVRWSTVHPTFHVSLLRPWRGRMPEKPPPILVDGCEEFEIGSIVAHQDSRRGRRYKVKWARYGPEEDQWLGIHDLTHAEDLLRNYHEANKLEPPMF